MGTSSGRRGSRQAASSSVLPRRLEVAATAADVAAISASPMAAIVPHGNPAGATVVPMEEPRQPDPVDELARQLERASLFNHASLDRVASRASGIEARLHELVELLREKGIVADAELAPPAAEEQEEVPADPEVGEEPPAPPPV